MNSSERISTMKLRGQRLAIIADLLATLDAPASRKKLVMVLYENDVISGLAAELLIETFRLETS